MIEKQISVIGAGHMGQALIEGLVRSGQIDSAQIVTSSRSETNREAVASSDLVFVAVKPLIAREVLAQIGSQVAGKLVISMMAGVSVDLVRKWTGNCDQQVIRLMANIPIAINSGVTGLYSQASDQNTREVRSIMSSLGLVVETQNESDLETLTLISACGPAIVSLFVSLMTEYGARHDLAGNSRAVLQTFRGTIDYLEHTDTNADELMTAVATKGGITEAILSTARSFGMNEVFDYSMDTGLSRLSNLVTKLYKL